ncbi:MAG TPA: HDOD domain-containing protein [Kofleriaceae bacterium]|nr:HDOD domain-containing protein [Kofleriaceae bacterium]
MTTKPRVLFVDDEPAILAGLQNLLYRERKRWDLVFATSGAAGLAELERQPADVVVSDIQMPGMDGASFLTSVRERCPGAARIVLSGHAHSDAIVRVLPASHQLLGKPCEAAALRAAIERGLVLRSTSLDAGVTAAIAGLDRLPSPRSIVDELHAALASSADVDDLSHIIKRDPGLSAKVLQVANFPYFGSARTCSIGDAIGRLGSARLRQLAATSTAFTSLASPDHEEAFGRLQASARRTARLAAAFVPAPLRSTVYAAALLHDVGHVALFFGMGERYLSEVRPHEGGYQISTECELLGSTHADLGARLLELWGLPAEITDVVRHHHTPDRAAPANLLAAAAVHVADALGHHRGENHIDRLALQRAGLGDRVDEWLALSTTRSS